MRINLVTTFDIPLCLNVSQLRVFGSKEEPLFLKSEIKKMLELEKLHIRSEDKHNGPKIPIIIKTGQQLMMNTVTEKGLYHIIQRSNKPVAKLLNDWLFGAVLPSIRKTGSYTATPEVKEQFRRFNNHIQEQLSEQKQEVRETGSSSTTIVEIKIQDDPEQIRQELENQLIAQGCTFQQQLDFMKFQLDEKDSQLKEKNMIIERQKEEQKLIVTERDAQQRQIASVRQLKQKQISEQEVVAKLQDIKKLEKEAIVVINEAEKHIENLEDELEYFKSEQRARISMKRKMMEEKEELEERLETIKRRVKRRESII